jgi:CheY-like chemotaxis protein/HPt (histidine-containing phosphotransfer) domain-containing protein
VSTIDPHHRILLVEDSGTNRMLTSQVLAQAGYAVDEVADGRSAVQAAAACRYDLILMDLTMPGLDAVEATRGIRRLPHPRGDMPILTMTGTSSAADKDRCCAAGIDGFLSTATDLPDVLEAVSHWVEAADDPTWGLEARPGVTPPLVNRRTLVQLEEDVGSDQLPELLLTFLRESARRAGLLEARVSANDPQGAADQAHALKGSAGTFGAMALRHLVYDLEQAGRAGECERLAALLPELRRLVAATSVRLCADYPFLAP